MAVGGYSTSLSAQSFPLAEQLAGGRWSIQTMPLPPGGTNGGLEDVSCASTGACTAVGAYYDSLGASRLLVEQWNGSSWSVQTVPEPAGATTSDLAWVSCPSSSFCVAVGTTNAGPLVERWDGISWSIWQVPVPPGGLGPVSCPSSTSCIFVGGVSWDGSDWSTQSFHSIAAAKGGDVQDVSCTSSRSCIAVSDYTDRRGFEGWLGERWDGTRWSTQVLPNPPQGEIFVLSGVSCASSTACTTVGEYTVPTGANYALAERWDGRRWSAQTVLPHVGQDSSGLNAVSCTTRTSCTAVGYRGNETIVAQWPAVVPSNQFTVRHVRVHRNGTVEFDVTVPNVGQLDVLETNWTPSPPRRSHTVLLRPGPHRYAFARHHLGMAHAGTLHVTVRPSALGARQVRHHYRAVRINLWVTYQPTGGTPANAAFINLLVTR
jgi:hypothetical protein